MGNQLGQVGHDVEDLKSVQNIPGHIPQGRTIQEFSARQAQAAVDCRGRGESHLQDGRPADGRRGSQFGR